MAAAPQATAQRRVLRKEKCIVSVKETSSHLLQGPPETITETKSMSQQKVFISALWRLHLGIWIPSTVLRLSPSPYLNNKMTFWLENPKAPFLQLQTKHIVIKAKI